jgi:hypothetical protein
MKIRIIKSAKNKKSHYTQVLNEIAQNNNLTLEEKGLMLYFLSLPEDWKINKVKLHKTLNVGRDKLNSIWKGLVEKGYLQTKYRNENGKFIYEHYVYEIPPITENPSTVNDIPITEKPLTVEPCTENTSTYKQIITNKLLQTNIILDTSIENNINNTSSILGKNQLEKQLIEMFPMFEENELLHLLARNNLQRIDEVLDNAENTINIMEAWNLISQYQTNK